MHWKGLGLVLALLLALPADAAPPTVVFLPGLGDGAQSFAAVARGLEGVAPLVRDARPARMKGDADGRRSGAEVARDLDRRLAARGAAPPFLLVGHSIGGTYALAYARLFPQKVAGVILVDGRMPGFTAACQEARLNGCEVPSLLRALLPAGQRRELDGMAETEALIGEPRDFGSVPVTVIVATEPSVGLSRDFQSLWVAWGKTFAAALPSGRFLRAERSSHYIQQQLPALVTGEIRRSLGALP